MKRSQPSPRARARFLEAGIRVLARSGHAGLKLAQVCEEAGATSGSFYYAFRDWGTYTGDLVVYWRDEIASRAIQDARATDEVGEQLDRMIRLGLGLPHGSEAAIRVWAAHDPAVMSIQAAVDRERFEAIAATYDELLGDREKAERYAHAAMFLFIGHQSGTLQSPESLDWAFRTLMSHALDHR